MFPDFSLVVLEQSLVLETMVSNPAACQPGVRTGTHLGGRRWLPGPMAASSGSARLGSTQGPPPKTEVTV